MTEKTDEQKAQDIIDGHRHPFGDDGNGDDGPRVFRDDEVHEDDPDQRPITSILITPHRGDDDSGRAQLARRASRFHDRLHWRTENGASGKLDRLLGRRIKN